MFRSILVPLDGSSFAEQALPFAVRIAERANGRLHLVRVHGLYASEDLHAGRAPFNPSFDDEYRAKIHYLEGVAKSIESLESVAVSVDVPSGSAAIPATIAIRLLERAHADGADLVVINGHRLGSVRRFFFGSVADEIVRQTDVPILLTPVSDRPAATTKEALIERIVVPLDGSHLSESVLNPAMQLALQFDARIELLQVVESPSLAAFKVSRETGEDESAAVYLESIAKRLRHHGLQVATRVIRTEGRAADTVAEALIGPTNRVIALATHGRGGFSRLLMGSVADRVVRETRFPILLYRSSVAMVNDTARVGVIRS